MKRTAYFDNAKAILIYLVVLGHLLSGYLLESKWLDTLYLVIYLFHMPAFILISGHFSRKIKSMADIKKVIRTLLIPYMIFQIIYTFYYKNVFGDAVQFELFEPRYALWFLLSMIMWKMMLWVFSGHKWMIAVSIILSLWIGYIGEVNEWLSLSRTFFFFPFFLIGFYLNRDFYLKLKKKWNMITASLLAVMLTLFIYRFGNVRWQEWFFGRIPYEDIQTNIVDIAMLNRGGVYVLMLLSTYIFLTLVPTKTRAYTGVGEKTLAIYLLHLLLVRAYKETPLYTWVEDTHSYVLVIILAFGIVYLLSRNWVWQIISPILTVPKKIK